MTDCLPAGWVAQVSCHQNADDTVEGGTPDGVCSTADAAAAFSGCVIASLPSPDCVCVLRFQVVLPRARVSQRHVGRDAHRMCTVSSARWLHCDSQCYTSRLSLCLCLLALLGGSPFQNDQGSWAFAGGPEADGGTAVRGTAGAPNSISVHVSRARGS